MDGTFTEYSGGIPPGDSTVVAKDFPGIDYDILRDIAQYEGYYFADTTSFFAHMDTSYHMEFDTQKGDSVMVYDLIGKVIYVDDPTTQLDIYDHIDEWDRINVEACFVPLGGLMIKSREYYHVAPDSFPALVSKGDIELTSWNTDITDPTIPVDIYGLIYTEDEAHMHRKIDQDRAYIKGAVIADYIHACVKYILEYDINVRHTSWLFTTSGNTGKLKVVSWRELKRG
jgi:hypothetical protein